MRIRQTFVACLGLCAALASQGPLVLEFVHRNSPTAQKYLIETMGGGVAIFDYDNDGRLDLFFINSGNTAVPGLFGRNEATYWNRLYRQTRTGAFEDVTVAAGLDRGPNLYGMGVATGDVDNDGFLDLVLTGYGGAVVLYRNDGKGKFSVDGKFPAVTGWTVSAGFFDYDNDGWLDLFVTRYLDWQMSKNILCGTPFQAYCQPNKFPAVTNVLLHNEGRGVFRDVSAAAGLTAKAGKALGLCFEDFDLDGNTDVFVANDGMEQYLFRNEGRGRFAEMGLEAGVAFGDDGKPFAGMGVACADYDNDGRPDIAVTNLALERFALFRNTGAGIFDYASTATGLAGQSARSSGWGAAFGDWDNDGRKDLFVAQSHVLDNVDRIHAGLRYQETAAIYWSRRGKFERIDVGAARAWRGAAFGDLNEDGALDAVLTELGGRPVIHWGKPAKGQHWLLLRLKGKENRFGIGARVRAGQIHGYASTAGSYLSASDARVHLGLGERTQVDLEVVWPKGKRQVLKDVRVDRELVLEEPE